MGYGDPVLKFIPYDKGNWVLPDVPALAPDSLNPVLLPRKAHFSSPYRGGTLVTTNWDPNTRVQNLNLHPSVGNPDDFAMALKRGPNGFPLSARAWLDRAELSLDARPLEGSSVIEASLAKIKAYITRYGGQVRTTADGLISSDIPLARRIEVLKADPRVHSSWKDLITSLETARFPRLGEILDEIVPDRWHSAPTPHFEGQLRARGGSASLGSLLALVGVCVAVYGMYEIYQHSDNIADFGSQLISSAKKSFSNMSLVDAALMCL